MPISLTMGRFPTILIWAIALLPSLYLAWYGRDLPHLGAYHDDAIYLETARSLASEGSYRLNSLPWTPAQTKYPPLYPLYLSLAWHAGGDLAHVLPIAMFLNWLWLPVWLLGLHRLLRTTGLPPALATLLPAFLALHPEVQLTATRLMSDLMCTALITWSLALRSAWLPALTVVVRTAALPLAVGLSLDAALARQWRRALLLLAPTLVVIAIWLGWSALNKYPATTTTERYYTDYLGYQLDMVPLAQLPAHLWNQLNPFFDTIARALLLRPVEGPGFFPLTRLVALAAIAGTVRLWRQPALRAYILYGAFTSVVMLAWYFPPDTRTLLPLLPLFLLGFHAELTAFGTVLRGAITRGGGQALFARALYAIALLLPIVAAHNAWRSWLLTGPRLIRTERRLAAQAHLAYAWIRDNTSPDTTFYTVDDPVLALHTHRRALRTPVLEQAFYRNSAGEYALTATALHEIAHFNLDCIYISARNFEASSQSPDASLRFSLEGSGLETTFRTPTEWVACRGNKFLKK